MRDKTWKKNKDIPSLSLTRPSPSPSPVSLLLLPPLDPASTTIVGDATPPRRRHRHRHREHAMNGAAATASSAKPSTAAVFIDFPRIHPPPRRTTRSEKHNHA